MIISPFVLENIKVIVNRWVQIQGGKYSDDISDELLKSVLYKEIVDLLFTYAIRGKIKSTKVKDVAFNVAAKFFGLFKAKLNYQINPLEIALDFSSSFDESFIIEFNPTSWYEKAGFFFKRLYHSNFN